LTPKATPTMANKEKKGNFFLRGEKLFPRKK